MNNHREFALIRSKVKCFRYDIILKNESDG